MFKQTQESKLLKLGPNSASQTLYFFGAKHTNDPEDLQFYELKEFWEAFLHMANEERVVMVEGAAREVPEDYTEAIRTYGETGAIHWLAREVSVDVIRPEPSEEEQRKSLCASFSPHLASYTLIVQNLAGFFRHTSSTSFDEAISRVLNREAKFSEIYGFTPNKLWLEDQHKKLFGGQKLEDKSFLDSITDPRKGETLINNVVALRSKLRDEHILSVITEAWKARKSVFIVYGKGHLATLEPSLRQLIAG